MKILNGQLACERAEKELQAIVTLGVSEEVLTHDNCLSAKGSRQQTSMCTRQ